MRSEGEIVFLQDTIELQSRGDNHFVSFSKKQGINFRLVGKTSPKSWKIRPFSRIEDQNEVDFNSIRAGDFCRLFHREIEGFIRVGFNDLQIRKRATKEKPAIVQIFDQFLPDKEVRSLFEIHLSLSNTLQKSKPSHSSLNIFQIELQRQNDGGIITWKRRVRFKHISTGNYLVYTSVLQHDSLIQKQFSLTPNFNNQNTLFKLIPVAADNIRQYATFNSLARIQHCKSGSFINADSGLRQSDLTNMLAGARNSVSKGRTNKSQDDDDDQETKTETKTGYGKQTYKTRGAMRGIDSQSGLGGAAASATEKQKQEELMRGEEKQIKYWEKKRNLRMLDFIVDEDVYKIQPVPDEDVLDLQTIQGHRSVLLNSLDYIRKYYKKHPKTQYTQKISGQNLSRTTKKKNASKVAKIFSKLNGQNGVSTNLYFKKSPSSDLNLNILDSLTQTLIWLIIEATSLSKSSYTDEFDVLYEMVKNTSHKPIKKKIMCEQYIMEIVLRILYEIWHQFFKDVYSPDCPSQLYDKFKVQKKRPYGKALINISKFSHLLLKVIVRDNKSALKRIHQLEVMDFLLEQITTPWDICYRQVFKLVSDDSSMRLGILQKDGIKLLADKLHSQIIRQNYNNKILDLLTYLCAPGGKPHRRIQDNVLDIIFGYQDIPQHFSHYIVNGFRQNEWNIQDSCYIMPIVRNQGKFFIYPNTFKKRKPPYFQLPKQGVIVDVKYSPDVKKGGNQSRRVPIQDFFIEADYVATALGIESQKKLTERVMYFRSLLKLYAALSSSLFKAGQQSVQRLAPPQFIIECLKSNQIILEDKEIFINLLIKLYINYYRLPPQQEDLVPNVLHLDQQSRGGSQDFSNQLISERERIFTMNVVDLSYSEQRAEHRMKLKFQMNSKKAKKLKKLGIKNEEPEDLQSQLTEANKVVALPFGGEVRKQALGNAIGDILKIGQQNVSSTQKAMRLKMLVRKVNDKQKLQAILKLTVYERVLQLRSSLHNYIVQTLQNCRLSWDSQDKQVSFYNHFFQLMRELVIRFFFHPQYDNFMRNQMTQEHPKFHFQQVERRLIDLSGNSPGILIHDGLNKVNQKRMMRELPDYVQKSLAANMMARKIKKRKVASFIEYKNFYLLLKYSLTQKLRALRPQYFLPDGALDTDSQGLNMRLDCFNPRSNLISSVKLHISAVLQLIYDYYESKILKSYWNMCKFIINTIVRDDKNKKLVNIKNKKKSGIIKNFLTRLSQTARKKQNQEAGNQVAMKEDQPDEEPHLQQSLNNSSFDKFHQQMIRQKTTPLNKHKFLDLTNIKRGGTTTIASNKFQVSLQSHADLQIEQAENRQNAMMDSLRYDDQLIAEDAAEINGSRIGKVERSKSLGPSYGKNKVNPRVSLGGSINYFHIQEEQDATNDLSNNGIEESDYQIQKRRKESITSDADKSDGVNIVVFQPVTQKKLQKFQKEIKRFVQDFIYGKITNHAIGEYNSLDQDKLMQYAVDMLQYKSPDLIVSTMNLIYRHFK